MKNIIKLKAMLRIAGIIALAAVIGFSMIVTLASCDDGSGGPGGGGGGGGGYGTLTVTGLPRGDWSVNVYAAGTDLSTEDQGEKRYC